MQEKGHGGLMSIVNGTGHISIVGSTLTNVSVCAQHRVLSEYPRTVAPVELAPRVVCRPLAMAGL